MICQGLRHDQILIAAAVNSKKLELIEMFWLQECRYRYNRPLKLYPSPSAEQRDHKWLTKCQGLRTKILTVDIHRAFVAGNINDETKVLTEEFVPDTEPFKQEFQD